MYDYTIATRTDQPIGLLAKTFVVFSTALMGTGSAYGLDRVDEWQSHLQSRVGFTISTEPVGKLTQRPDIRRAGEHIENIRSVFNPSVADLATYFEVSRQTIYTWLENVSTPEPGKFARISELSRIADKFREAGISRSQSLLKMKTFGGRSLMDLFLTGNHTDEHISALIDEARAMEASYKQSGLSSSKATPTNDWQSSISIPGSLE